MTFTKVGSRRGVTAACAGLLLSVSACGDSTGPGKLEPSAALQSLALGMGSILIGPSPIPATMDESLGALASILGEIDVTIDGKTQTMFALGMRETFPAGTCLENVFIFPSFPPEPGICTPPDLGLGVILWQSHSPFAPPDRMILIVADIGTIDFDFGSFTEFDVPATLPLSGVAMYLEGEDNFWISTSGSLTSQVAATSQPCGIPLPPYVKAGSCSVATFDEQGAITFELLTEAGPSDRRLNVTIPRQTINGLWLDITETQPVTFPDFQRNSLKVKRMLRTGADASD
jgi:hypothetical protein